MRTVIVVTHSAELVASSDVALAVSGDGDVQVMTPVQALSTYFSPPKAEKPARAAPGRLEPGLGGVEPDLGLATAVPGELH
jgi:hypothetical protein